MLRLPAGRRVEITAPGRRWLAAVVVLWLILRALGQDFAVAQAVFLGTGLSLAGILPLQTIGGLGLMEASLSMLLVIVGLPAGEAAAVGLAGPLMWLLMTAAWGGAWMILRALRPHRKGE